MTHKIPPDANQIIPSLSVMGAAEAIALYTRAFGAQEMYRMEYPGGDKIMHACLIIGNTKFFLSDANPEMGCAPSASSFYAYFEDVDAMFQQARAAGLDEFWPLTDMFWGDRMGTVKDKFGIYWTLATHMRDVAPEDMTQGRDAWAAQMKAKVAC